MLSVVLVLAAASNASVPPRLAAPGLTALNVEEKLTTFCNEHLAQQLAFEGVHITTAKEIASVLGAERQRQMLSCGESSNCLVELANALGVDALVIGDLARIGDHYQLDLKAMSATDGGRLAGYSARAENQEQLVEHLNKAARALAVGVAGALHKTLAPQTNLGQVAQATTPRQWAWLPAAGGATLAIGGGVCIGLALSDYGQLTGGPIATAQAARLASSGQTLQTVGWALATVGVVGLLSGAGLFAFGGGSAPVAIAPQLGTSAGVAVVGVWR